MGEVETRLEAILRGWMSSYYDSEVARIDAAESAGIKEYKQTHETFDGRRIELTKKWKLAKYNELLDRIFSDDIDISVDAINQVEALDDCLADRLRHLNSLAV